MKKVFMYGHGGSKNHGCEAIVRSTKKVIGDRKVTLHSLRPEEDYKYLVDEVVDIKKERNETSKFNLKRIWASLNVRLLKNEEYSKKLQFDELFKTYKKDDIAIAIGGDNYCYKGFDIYGIINKGLVKKGVKTVLWGCSIEPDMITKEMENDLKRYSLITVRETLTYNAVKNINKNVKLYPDTAFQLDKVELPLPDGFEENNTVGINVSPLIISCEEKSGATMENYKELIKHIIDTTDMQVALIPHVVWDNNDDRKPLRELYNEFKDTKRVVMIEDNNCLVQKGYISRCRMFIGARTHATIAAYSSCVPTLVIGYSIKAKGIAKDIFGTYENYVLPVQSLKNKDDLINAFEWMKINEASIKQHLDKFMPKYKEKTLLSKKEIDKLLG